MVMWLWVLVEKSQISPHSQAFSTTSTITSQAQFKLQATHQKAVRYIPNYRATEM